MELGAVFMKKLLRALKRVLMGESAEPMIARVTFDENVVEITIKCSKKTFYDLADINQALWDKAKRTP